MWPTLKNRRQFDLVYTRGYKRTSQTLVVFLLDTAPDRRVAYVASRVVGGAVQRNRAKRLLRTAFRQVAGSRVLPTAWIVLVARGRILEHQSDFVTEELREVLVDLLARCGPTVPVCEDTRKDAP